MHIELKESWHLLAGGVVMAVALTVSTLSIHYVLRQGRASIEANNRQVKRNYHIITDMSEHLSKQDKIIERNTEAINTFIKQTPRNTEPCPMP